MSISLSLHDYQSRWSTWLWQLNQANLPEVSPLDEIGLARLAGMQHALRIAQAGDEPVGAIFLMRPGQSYQSANYRWFDATGEDFLYIDRVMVEAQARGLGIGRKLYEDAEAIAHTCGAPRLTCEINTEPPNPGSMAFHKKCGFVTLEERPSDDGKRVAMMEKRLLC